MIFEPIPDEYLPNENLEYGNPHSNALLTFFLKETMNMLSVACTCSRYQLHKSLLVHRIRISEIYPGIENLLTYSILPRLSRGNYIHWLCWNSRIWSSSDVIVILK